MGTKYDVIRHEAEHVRDYERIFNSIFSGLSYSTFLTYEECNQKMKRQAKCLKQKTDEALKKYSETGHSKAKFETGGEFFVEGVYL